MDVPRRLIVSPDLNEYFRNEVTEAKADLGLKLGDIAEFYLVNLLCEYARAGAAPAPGGEPLALLYKRAREANLGERVRLLKDLGDLSLYVAGFFTESIERTLVDKSYYIAMGGGAYSDLSGLIGMQRQGELFAKLYVELAQKFSALVGLLNEIADRSREASDDEREVLALYERWIRTKSERLRRLLIDKGMQLPECDDDGDE
jgi:hypothetical protein